MGIYGESMSLITEGKISNKLEDMFFNIMDKIFTIIYKFEEKDKKKKSINVAEINHKAYEETYKMKYPGYYKYWEDKNIFEDLEKIFCKIDKESSDDYLKFIKGKFKTTDFNKIKEDFERNYGQPKFSIKESEVENLHTNYREWYDIDEEKANMQYNINKLKEYEKDKNFNPKDNFVLAINLQISLCKFLYSLLDNFETEFDINYEENRKRIQAKEENK